MNLPIGAYYELIIGVSALVALASGAWPIAMSGSSLIVVANA